MKPNKQDQVNKMHNLFLVKIFEKVLELVKNFPINKLKEIV